MTEMGQKTGALPIGHREREVLGLTFPLLAFPWTVLGLVGLLLPVLERRRVDVPWQSRDVWFPWWWSVGNLLLLSGWAVAKPNYFVPCLPGLAILLGMAWLRLCAAAREPAGSRTRRRARRLLALQWGLLILSGVLVPPLARRQLAADSWPTVLAVALVVCSGAAIAGLLWRRGRDALAPLPVAVAVAAAVLLGYGLIAPAEDPARGHAGLALQIARLVPPEVKTLRFFHEIDEGLWFYLRSPRLAPVPGSQPRYSDSHDNRKRTLEPTQAAMPTEIPPSPSSARTRHLRAWLKSRGGDEPFVLLRSTVYEYLLPDLEGTLLPAYREQGLKRNELVLLQVAEPTPIPPAASPPVPPLRP
jgi:hypothetical protein